MTYQTGTVNNVHDLLDALRVFAQGIGWTINSWSSLTGGSGESGKWLDLYHANSGYFSLVAWIPGSGAPWVELFGHTGWNGANSYYNQPGSQYNQWGAGFYPSSNEMSGPFTAYHFFGSTQYLHVVVEVTTGRYKHICIGTLNKLGSYTGGQYIQAVNWWMNYTSGTNYPDYGGHHYLFDWGGYSGWNNKVNFTRADLDGRSAFWLMHTPSDPTPASDRRAYGSVRGYGMTPSGWLWRLYNYSPNSFNALTPLLPILVAAERVGDEKYSPLGHAPDIRYCNMKNLSPGDLITIGSDQWLVFPAIQKTSVWNQNTTTPSSGYYGYAYKKA